MITTDTIMAWRPCYPRSRVAELVGEGLTLADILRLPIPAVDRVWAAVQHLARSDWHTLECWLDMICERAIRMHCLGCGVPAVEEWATAWLAGDQQARTAEAAWAAAAATWAARAAKDAAVAAAEAWEAAKDAAAWAWEVAALLYLIGEGDAP